MSASATEERLAAELGALSNPIRIRALRTIASEGSRSPIQLTEQMPEPLGVISYHVRMLKAAGLIELARTVRVRGAIEHRYRMTDRGRELLAWLERL